MAEQRTPVTIGNARFTVYTDGCIRMEYAHDGRFSPYPSLLTGHKARSIRAAVHQVGKKLTIRTPRMTLTYRDTGQVFCADNLAIRHRNHVDGEETWFPGKKDSGNLGSVRRCLDQWKWCGGPEHFPQEGLLSTQGGHFIPDEPRVYWNTRYDWPENYSNRVAFDGYFFAYGCEYRQALKDFVTVFGPIPMIPRWAFGLWYSRWYAYHDQELVDLVKRYRKEGIPIDVMVIDTDWRDGWGGYDWSKKYFPKPARAMKNLHDLGVRTSLNDHPGYGNYDCLPDHDSHIPAIQKRLGPLPHQGQWACDWSNREAVRAWKDILLGSVFDKGVDFWWIDGWIKSPFSNLDSQLWANRQYYELTEEKTGNRGLILSRWGGIGSHRYPVQFSGDTPSEWHMLRHQVEFTACSGNLGAAYWSHDIGGFFGKKVDEELFIRWVQFGAMSPILRTHSDHGIREPWKYSARARRLFRKQTRIRYALIPYLYTLAHEAHTEGLPLVRPLYLEFNRDNDGGALYRRGQYLLGRDLLIVPADQPVDASTGRCRKRACFPDGTWLGLETDEVHYGMKDCHVEIPLDLIPTYVRQGAIIPSQPVGEAIGTAVPERIEFDWFPDPDADSACRVYEDDGQSCEYRKGQRVELKTRGRRVAGGYRFSFASKGSYPGMPKQREIVVRVRLEADEKIRAVRVRHGKGEWSVAKGRLTRQCLAGTVKSQMRFYEVTVSGVIDSLEIDMSF